MTITIEDVSAESISDLFDWSEGRAVRDAGCRYCVYWEHPERGDEALAARAELKAEWFRRVITEFGGCGKVARAESELAGFIQYAPPRYFPTARTYASGPPSEEGVFISCLVITPACQRQGMGSALLRAVLEELQARGTRHVETYARRGSANNPSGPLGFWLKHEFIVLRDDLEFPLVGRELA